ncbi:hypothetical protein [Paraburkholderia phenazinium]|jgi:hypothetical protein|uniref:Uncharacterized protein n=1 Tax=Paraburkholderia phenazinium TaxID=60549 RepID=A0A1G7YTU4_9BURK|nr:hypothetical protein [Paraburkholderia phenazinium]SDG99953.1 hypothetical protein SAMN05216466_106318 [Paraburkholderia phenazinium]
MLTAQSAPRVTVWRLPRPASSQNPLLTIADDDPLACDHDRLIGVIREYLQPRRLPL